MRSYTVHLRNTAPPVLVREGFSVWAMFLGPFWLAQKRAWLAAVMLLLTWMIVLSIHWTGQPPMIWVLFWMQGLFGLDWRRRNLQMRGYDLSFVVLGQNENAAMARLLGEYPGLRSRMTL